MTSNGKGTSTKRATMRSKPTAAQQRARRDYVRRTGHKVTAEQVEKLLSQWRA